jgi:aspartate/methionine/tyrosine aminotransferase
VAEIAAFADERGIRVLSDEVWSDVVLDDSPFASFAGARAPAWTIYGLSKGYALAGLRIGAVIAPDAASAEEFARAAGFEHTIEGASTVSQVAAVAALDGASEWRDAFLAHCARQRDRAVRRLRVLRGVRIERAPQATFVLFIDIRGTGIAEDELSERIERLARVRVVPGSPRWFGAGAAGHVRLSLATTEAVLDEALGRIERAWTEITGT